MKYNNRSLGRSTTTRALSTRMQTISNQLVDLKKQIDPIITLKGKNSFALGSKKTLTIRRKVMTRFVSDAQGFGSFGVYDIGLPSGGFDNSLATPLKITVMGAPLQFIQVTVKPDILNLNGNKNSIGFPNQEQVRICPASLNPSMITIDIPDALAPHVLDISKIFDVNTAPNQQIFICLTYAQVISA